MSSIRRSKLSRLGIVCIFLVCLPRAHAWETDQYTHRQTPLADSLAAMNDRVNQALVEVQNDWQPVNSGNSEHVLARRVYRALSFSQLEGRYEYWLNHDDAIARLELGRDHIYADASLLGARGNWLFGACPTIRVGGIRMGTDKPGHFLSQGYRYYEIARLQGFGAREAAAQGLAWEHALYGDWVSGVFSNADLVANYEGLKFYDSLSHDHVVAGKPALFRWELGVPFLQRPFDWSDHISEFWDEALLPSKLVPELQPFVAGRLRRFCGEYRARPLSYTAQSQATLWQRYAALGLIDASENRLDRLCGSRGM